MRFIIALLAVFFFSTTALASHGTRLTVGAKFPASAACLTVDDVHRAFAAMSEDGGYVAFINRRDNSCIDVRITPSALGRPIIITVTEVVEKLTVYGTLLEVVKAIDSHGRALATWHIIMRPVSI